MQIFIGLITIIIYLGITYYLGWNLKKWIQSFGFLKRTRLYWVLVYFISISPFLGMSMDSLWFLKMIGSYWMFVFQYGLLICLTVNLIMVVPIFRHIKIVGSIAVVGMIVLFTLGTYFAYTPTTREITLEIDKKGEPMRIVMASDFHIGLLAGKGHLERFVKLSNEAKPDIVLLSGDIIDDDPKWYIKDNMHEVMLQLETKYGVYGALGNHEYYGNEIDLFVEEMEKSNVQILMDETIAINNQFYLTGQEDLTNENRKPIAQLKPADETKPWIVMNHTPVELTEQAKEKVDLILSGHTHRGQIWPNNYITEWLYEIDYGHGIIDGMNVIVSSGFGFWGPPTRIGSQAEIWIIDLRFKSS